MFLRRNNKITDLEHFQAKAFALYRSDIFKLHEQLWKEEDIKGDSYLYYKLIQYYFAFYLVSLLYKDFQEGFLSKEELWKKYNIDCNRTKLACHGISLDELLKIFHIEWVDGEGIEFVEIEKNHIVDGITGYSINYKKVDIRDYLDCNYECLNLVTDCYTIERSILNVDDVGLTTERCKNYLLI